MEVAGLALALLPLCSAGFCVVDKITSANRGLRVVLTRWEIQRDRFEDWCDVWQDDRTRIEKLAIERPRAATRILKQLCLLSQTLFDLERLEKRFGIKLMRRQAQAYDQPAARNDLIHEDVSGMADCFREGLSMPDFQGIYEFRRRCNVNLTLMQRFTIALSGRRELESLVDLLKEYNDTLRDFSPKMDMSRIARGFDHLDKLVTDQLLQRAEAANYEAEHTSVASEAQRYRDLALAATFLDAIRHGRHDPVEWWHRLEDAFCVSHDLMGISPGSPLFTVAILRRTRRICLIEWLDNAAKRDLAEPEKTARMLNAPHPPRLLLPRGCHGMFGGRSGMVGFVLTCPEYIATLPPPHDLILPPPPNVIPDPTVLDFISLRGPIALRDVIRGVHPSYPSLDLGTRFLIGQKLVGAVRMMHAVGWVHKNIRAQRILFYPSAESISAQLSRHGGQKLMFDEPQLLGFSYTHAHDSSPEAEKWQQSDSGSVASQSDQLVVRDAYTHAQVCLDYYQHPHSLEDPSAEFLRFYDWYSLGCVLLEIGRWETLDDSLFQSGRKGLPPPRDALRLIQGLATPEKLDKITGTIYGTVVRKCLDLGNEDNLSAEEQFALETDMESYIGRCTA
ncbi:hypothetical protein B0H63DRAFT_559886 [Podospora didyma]|uniref:Prion-inhibition and propagation HeLo domain-containing protein n=1 Tax=Podospora didyma TaxID=330526 RepID=A0AAE0NPM0_9PEZI|nr:hypothetical protein B0H63DRAFT_559886 [Podospora didyma]